MRLPSFQTIIRDALNTLARFPLVLLSATAATTAALILVNHEGPPQSTLFWSILYGGALGIPLFTALDLLSERTGLSPALSWGLRFAGICALFAYASTIPGDIPQAPDLHVVRLLLLISAAHLMVASLPFLGRSGAGEFWQFNILLFFRILVAMLFAQILFAGLAFALAAVDNLFALHISGKRYLDIWILSTGLFTTWFFLAGIPKERVETASPVDYPRGLKVFAQFILLPIALVYLAILIAYLAKILFSWDWPQGWVSKLILGFSGTGLFTLLLLHPLQDRMESVWVRRISRWFFVVLIPLIAMLFPAVARRISQYGITEGRYLALALGAWLTLVVFYFLTIRSKDIRFIPLSLCAGTLIICSGPWGIFSVAERSQAARLEFLATKNHILVDGKIQKAGAPVSQLDTREISSILDYLRTMHGFESIQPWFGTSLRSDSIISGTNFKSAAAVAEMMGIEFTLTRPESGGTISISTDKDQGINIAQYQGHIHLPAWRRGETRTNLAGGRLSSAVSDDFGTLTLYVHESGIAVDSMRISIIARVRDIIRTHGFVSVDRFPPDSLRVSGSSASARALVYIGDIRVQRNKDDFLVIGYDADLVYAFPEKPERPAGRQNLH